MKVELKLLVVLVLIMLPAVAMADGLIIIDRIWPPMPRPIPRPPVITPLAITRHHVDVEIQGNVALTDIDQIFHNPNNMQLEGTYIFPIPKGASVQRFTMYINGKEVEAEVLDADKARKIYEDIVRRKRDPALLEYYGRGLLKARVFPIPAKGDTRIKIQYHEVLKTDTGLVGYRYPLNTEKFSSAPIKSVSVRVTVNASRAITTIYSPSHVVDIKREGAKRAVVGFEQKSVKPDKDFQLYYLLQKSDVGMHVMSYADGREDGVFMLMISPGMNETGKTVPKDIVFVFDTSGSMSGKKIEQARKALLFCLNGLNPEDRFNLIPFSTEARPFRENLVKAGRNEIEAALKHVRAFTAKGGTNLNDALVKGLGVDSGKERPFIVVLMTDGLPTVGVTNEKEILKQVKDANRAKARIFTFGVGYDVNTHLLDGLTEAHRGVSEYVAPEESLELKVSSFYTKIASPVMTNLVVNITGVKTHDTYPKNISDLFRGSEIMIMGRYKGSGSARVTLSGLFGDEKRSFSYDAQFAKNDSRFNFLPRLWATRKVGYLLREIRLHGESNELKNEVKRLAKRYGLLTPYTSMLILEDEDRIRMRAARTPGGGHGLVMNGFALREIAKGARVGMHDRSGGAAFKTARRQSNMLQQSVASAAPGEMEESQKKAIKQLQRQVGPFTFYNRNGVWVDSRFNLDSKAEKIKFLSKRFFQILAKNPELSGAFALGERIIVVANGLAYEIVKE